jgi:hypothetical protein
VSDKLRAAVAALELHRRQRAQEEPPDLFSTAIASVADHEGAQWQDDALDVLHYVALTNAEFTIADVDPYLPPVIDKRSSGWLLREGARLGWMVHAGYTSGGPTRHGRPVVVWRSLINGGSAA